MLEVLLDALIDSAKLIPFLFITYIVLGLVERMASMRSQRIIADAGKFGPAWGGLLGAIPQCGFSAVATYFYVGRILTFGTLIAIYMSTSDEMLPILISEHASFATIAKIIGAKIVIGMISGFICDLVLRLTKKEPEIPEEFEVEMGASCNCTGGLLLDSVIRTIKLFFFIFVISLVIGILIYLAGEEALYSLFSNLPVIGELVAGLIGLIPNCAASVAITQLYLDGILGAGPMISGLLVSAGVGLLILVGENRNMKENVAIIGTLYVLGVAWGIIVEFTGFVF